MSAATQWTTSIKLSRIYLLKKRRRRRLIRLLGLELRVEMVR
jgi:hypothetical protein